MSVFSSSSMEMYKSSERRSYEEHLVSCPGICVEGLEDLGFVPEGTDALGARE